MFVSSLLSNGQDQCPHVDLEESFLVELVTCHDRRWTLLGKVVDVITGGGLSSGWSSS